jgi:fumarate hydratase, class I
MPAKGYIPAPKTSEMSKPNDVLSVSSTLPSRQGHGTLSKTHSDGVRVETFGPHAPRRARSAAAPRRVGDLGHQPSPPARPSCSACQLDDPEATGNDKFVTFDLLKNANIAAGGILPMCQDAGTAIVMGKKGRLVFTGGDDESALAEASRMPMESPSLFAAGTLLHVRGEEHQDQSSGAD